MRIRMTLQAVAATALAGTLAFTPTLALADTGGTGAETGGGSSDTRPATAVTMLSRDDYNLVKEGAPVQGTGTASITAMAQLWENIYNNGTPLVPSARNALEGACTQALNEADARYHKKYGAGAPQSRVVSIYWGHLPGVFNETRGGVNSLYTDNFQAQWDASAPGLVGYNTEATKLVKQLYKETLSTDTVNVALRCVALNRNEPAGGEPPKPNKVWVLDRLGALKFQDKNWTNQVAADEHLFTHSDPVAATVTTQVGGKYETISDNYQIVDDWSDAAKYVDLTEPHVYLDGTDITNQFTFKTVNGVTTATATTTGLATLGAVKTETDLKLVVIGKFKPLNDTTDTKNQTIKLLNKGWEIRGNKKYETNIPPVYIWNPTPPVKDVLSAPKQDGNQESINKKQVLPGQHLQYQINVTMDWANYKTKDPAYKLETFQIRDNYDPYFLPDKTSLTVMDDRTNKIIPKTNYTTTWDDAANTLLIDFTAEWIKTQLDLNDPHHLVVTFDGTVDKNIPPTAATQDKEIVNQAWEIINNSEIYTNKVTNTIPTVEPHKKDLNINHVDINGKTVMVGDILLYQLDMDATPSTGNLAYPVHILGMIDDYDDEYLSLNAKDIKVTDQTDGKDVTDKFNIQVKDGVAYIAAKFVDRTNSQGTLIKGDPQPTDLKKLLTYTNIDPITAPMIDQSLLGKRYWIEMPMKVIKFKDKYVIKNQAVENFENMPLKTEIVANPLQDINPVKDVTVEVAGDSINNQDVKLQGQFNYRLDSTILGDNRATIVDSWSIRDEFDTKHDEYTGVWAVYAATDIYDGDQVVYKKGDLLGEGKPVTDPDGTMADAPTVDGNTGEKTTGPDSETDTATVPSDLFAAAYKDGVFTIETTGKFNEYVNSNQSKPAGWVVYTKMIRVAPGDVHNRFTEKINDTEKPSNEVVTHTPENPGIDVEKYDAASGEKLGDRDQALNQKTIGDGDEKIVFKIKNTGDVPLKNIELTDQTTAGKGQVKNITCPEEMADGLEVGETITCTGILQGVEGTHADKATVTGESVYSGKKVSDTDLWHGVRPVLAATGSDGVLVGLLAAGLTLLGVGVTWYRRRYEAAVM